MYDAGVRGAPNHLIAWGICGGAEALSRLLVSRHVVVAAPIRTAEPQAEDVRDHYAVSCICSAPRFCGRIVLPPTSSEEEWRYDVFVVLRNIRTYQKKTRLKVV